MNPEAFAVLDGLGQGVVILDDSFRIVLANAAFLRLFGKGRSSLDGIAFCDVLPRFNKPLYHHIFTDTLYDGYRFFLSAAIHKDLLDCREKFNIHVSRIGDKRKFLLLEFTDVTAEFARIQELHGSMKKLARMNRKLAEKEKAVRNLAYYDSLTGVANRAFFLEVANRMIRSAERSKDLVGLMFIDVDQFKAINDTFGHEKGDIVLCHVAKVLTSSTRKTDLVARYGGDEFLVLLPKLRTKQDSIAVADKINRRNHISPSGCGFDVSFSIGVSFYPQNGKSLKELIRKADRAMYAAKHTHGQCCIFTYDELAASR